MTPRPVQHGGGVELDPCSTRTAVSASRSRLQRSTVHGELAVVVHDLPHQLPDDRARHPHSGQTRDLRDPSLALSDGCNGLRTRSLKPRRVAVSNRPTVTPLSRAQLLHQVQTTHPSPCARHFGLPFNGLAPLELRQMAPWLTWGLAVLRNGLAPLELRQMAPWLTWGLAVLRRVSTSRESRTRRSLFTTPTNHDPKNEAEITYWNSAGGQGERVIDIGARRYRVGLL